MPSFSTLQRIGFVVYRRYCWVLVYGCDNRLSSLSLGYNNNLSKAATVATNYRLDVLSVTNTVKVLNGTEKNCD